MYNSGDTYCRANDESRMECNFPVRFAYKTNLIDDSILILEIPMAMAGRKIRITKAPEALL